MLQWTWTAQVFFMLHTLTFLMKMHSYAFYNGHLSESQRRLADLDKPNPKTTSMSAAVRYPETASGTRPPKEKHHDNCHHDGDFLAQLREDLAMELTSPLGRVTYPQNLTWLNYLDYAFCPTICYEIEYPRSEGRSWSEVAIKALAVFGCIFFLILLSGEFITPVLIDAQLEIREARSPSETALILAETISILMFPFMIAFLLVFLVIFEYVLGAFAEITRFADRKFYSDWWNSCDWFVSFSPRLFATVGQSILIPKIGSNSPANGTSPSTTSSGDMYTSRRKSTSPSQLPCSSLSSSAPLLTSSS